MVISYRIPPGCRVIFDSIILYTRKPLPVEELNAGNVARIQIASAYPQKNLFFGNTEIYKNIQVKNCRLTASRVEKIRYKIRGSKNHHKFAYKLKGGEIRAVSRNKS